VSSVPRAQWRIQGEGGKSGHAPHRSWQWSVAPPGRKSNGSIVILSKSKDFAPPVSMSATDLAPLRKNSTHKTWKRSSGILGDRLNFWGEIHKFFGKRLKKVVQTNVGKNLAPPFLKFWIR